ncbi:MAG: right-handed parallel beta-helix repeat-containing protein [Cytophagaceae bacterium]
MKAILYFLLLFSFSASANTCNCSFTVSPAKLFYDGLNLSLKGGDTICVKAGQYKFLQFKNFSGDSLNPLVFVNVGGEVIIENRDHYYGITFNQCKYFKLSGKGSKDFKYGFSIKATGPGANGLTIGGMSTDAEIEFVEISNTGFAGIVAKTDPDCNGNGIRGSFLMKNIFIHDCYIHHTEGEGMYIGNSFYSGWSGNPQCKGKVLIPHELKNVNIINNILEDIGWDAIQVGSVTAAANIQGNSIKRYGVKHVAEQNNGIQIGEGTTAIVNANLIAQGSGNGIILMGKGNNLIYNNVIINAGKDGVFCDDRISTDTLAVFLIAHNNIINPGANGVTFMSDITSNYCFNNIIVNPGNFLVYQNDKTWKKGEDAFILIEKGIVCRSFSNIKTLDIATIKFQDLEKEDFRLTSASPCVDKGQVSEIIISTDFLNKNRPQGKGPDIGAFEYFH